MTVATATRKATRKAMRKATRTAYDVLAERGFIYQCSDEAGLRRHLDAGPVSVYCGFDPTARSLHLGHLVQVMALAHFQRTGNRPIALVGGGTAMIGDPTDKTSARGILSTDVIDANAAAIKSQLAGYLDFGDATGAASANGDAGAGGAGAIMVDNAEWLRRLNYLEFLRDYGRYFSVNEMLRMETYRTRLETGLSFLEFNYALLQGYDFLELFRRHACTVQIGGSDQWANMLAGTDLIRRAVAGTAYVLTNHLVTDSSGAKMGKTSASGQVWLDPDLTSPYDYYQFWVNVDDAYVARLLAVFTFVPMEEVTELTAAGGERLRAAKERLALEATTLAHGEEEARKAHDAARRLFGGASLEELASAEDIPTVEVDRARLAAGLASTDVLVEARLADSKGAARRLIEGGGAYLNQDRLSLRQVTEADLVDGALLLRSGKKRYVRVVAR